MKGEVYVLQSSQLLTRELPYISLHLWTLLLRFGSLFAKLNSCVNGGTCSWKKVCDF